MGGPRPSLMRSNATHKTRETNLEMARSKIRPSYYIHIQRTSLEKGHYSPFGFDMFLCLLLEYFRTTLPTLKLDLIYGRSYEVFQSKR